ncbi:Peptidase A1 domain-containing protein, partial [Podarcis lilfordi]
FWKLSLALSPAQSASVYPTNLGSLTAALAKSGLHVVTKYKRKEMSRPLLFPPGSRVSLTCCSGSLKAVAMSMCFTLIFLEAAMLKSILTLLYLTVVHPSPPARPSSRDWLLQLASPVSLPKWKVPVETPTLQ